ncbi:MAG: hypothetical protein IKW51_05400 [Bacteroidales bacterium]|nr:hypothetical protein [Bacteroidales bacterium]
MLYKAIEKVLLENAGMSMACSDIVDMILEKEYYESDRISYDGLLNNVRSQLYQYKDLFKKDATDKDRWVLVDYSGTAHHSVARATIKNEIRDKYNCATPSFVNKVKKIYKEKVVPSFEIIYDRKYAFIMKNIPIYFSEQCYYLENRINDDAKKYLGLYYRNYSNNKREIILFEDVIKSAANGDKEYLDNLIWKVIVHEYAHAIMDTMCNGDELRQQDPKLYKYREESLANAFALKVLEKSLGTIITLSGFDKIKEFVDKQDEEYKHGLDLYQRDDLLKMMEFWRGVKIIGN